MIQRCLENGRSTADKRYSIKFHYKGGWDNVTKTDHWPSLGNRMELLAGSINHSYYRLTMAFTPAPSKGTIPRRQRMVTPFALFEVGCAFPQFPLKCGRFYVATWTSHSFALLRAVQVPYDGPPRQVDPLASARRVLLAIERVARPYRMEVVPLEKALHGHQISMSQHHLDSIRIARSPPPHLKSPRPLARRSAQRQGDDPRRTAEPVEQELIVGVPPHTSAGWVVVEVYAVELLTPRQHSSHRFCNGREDTLHPSALDLLLPCVRVAVLTGATVVERVPCRLAEKLLSLVRRVGPSVSVWLAPVGRRVERFKPDRQLIIREGVCLGVREVVGEGLKSLVNDERFPWRTRASSDQGRNHCLLLRRPPPRPVGGASCSVSQLALDTRHQETCG